MSTHSYLGCVLAFVLTAGCGIGDSAAPLPNDPSIKSLTCKEALRTRFRSENGRSLQGTQGTAFTAVSADIDCSSVDSLHLQGAQLLGQIGNKQLAGTDFVGADLVVRDENGNAAAIEITAVEADASDSTGETFLYTLQYFDADSGTLKNACNPDKDGVAKALPLSGSWGENGAHTASNEITFACTSGALGKCSRWGYRPWQSHNGTSLAPYHQACTRMVRADYCGDGTTHTEDGTVIDVYDNLGLLVKDSDPLLKFEATWTPDGAYCIAKERWPQLTGLLSDSCLAQFTVAAESSPVDATDICNSRRQGVVAADSLLDNRSY